MSRANRLRLVIAALTTALLPLLFVDVAQATDGLIEPDSGLASIERDADGEIIESTVRAGIRGFHHDGERPLIPGTQTVADIWHWNLWDKRVVGFVPGVGQGVRIIVEWDNGCEGTGCGEHGDTPLVIPFGVITRSWLGHHTHEAPVCTDAQMADIDAHKAESLSTPVARNAHVGDHLDSSPPCEPHNHCINELAHNAVKQNADQMAVHNLDKEHGGRCVHDHPPVADSCTPAQRILIDIHKGGSLSTPAARDAHIGNHLYSNPDCPTHTHCIREPAHNAVEQNADQMAAHAAMGNNEHGSRCEHIHPPDACEVSTGPHAAEPRNFDSYNSAGYWYDSNLLRRRSGLPQPTTP